MSYNKCKDQTIYIFTTNFEKIQNINNECIQAKLELTKRVLEMKNKYSVINTENSKPIFTFCLDSYFHQYKMFTLELDHINKLWTLHNIRIYNDYYKLYNIIVKYVIDTSISCDGDINILNHKYKIPKEADAIIEYDIEYILKIHDNILLLIKYIYQFIDRNNDKIKHYNVSRKAGFSISNYLNTLNNDVKTTELQLTLFINYLSFFHISQIKNISLLTKNVNNVIDELSNNSNIDKRYSIIDVDMNVTPDDAADVVPVSKPPYISTCFITQFDTNYP